jgi:pullulanase
MPIECPSQQRRELRSALRATDRFCVFRRRVRSLSLLAILVSLIPSFALNASPVAVRATPQSKTYEPIDCNATGYETVLALAVDTAAAKLPARAYWLNRQLLKWPGVSDTGRFRIYHAERGQIIVTQGAALKGADGWVSLQPSPSRLDATASARFKHVADGAVLAVNSSDMAKVRTLLKQQLIMVQEDASGVVLNATAIQISGALDDLYEGAKNVDDLGVTATKRRTQFKLWAPTALAVSVCTYDSGASKALARNTMAEDVSTGVWTLVKPNDLSGKYYKYFVDVYVNGVGLVRNAVTDPYSVSLTTDSKRSYIADLNSAKLKPEGWDKPRRATKVVSATDMVIYELHVRDFSINDATVSAANRGKYLAFTEPRSNGMKHLSALADAGLTDVHLLPVFDISTVPESGCVSGYTAPPSSTRDDLDSEAPQATIAAVADKDCFNWGYDPFHFSAPEGSYATDAADGARRILEFRQMVVALHRAGLRVGMDVVYNHTFQSGQKEKSVLDRIVPGYYHRLNAEGAVEQSTCCDNTATEHMMMGKLMIDSTMLWAKQYQIDSFRFDLMGHQPRAVMLELQKRVNRAAGREVQLIGEGWNFGEVADGKRFEQASQLSLNGSGIGTFSDRTRDAVRGGGAADSGENLVKNQGYINGLFYDANEMSETTKSAVSLLRAADMVRVGLAGSIRDYSMQTFDDKIKPLSAIDYGGQPAGYVSQPNEVVNYVDNHDNQTLFDINAYRLPLTTSTEDRVRVQMLGAAITAFSQGIAYFHAGIDTLRSKSMDGNSYDSGDWFNRLDWTYTDNYFGIGAPQKKDNAAQYAFIKPRLANTSIKPAPKDIVLARDMFRDLLRIRASSALFRLTSAADISKRLQFFNTGAKQNPVVIVGHLNGTGLAGAKFNELMYFINVDKTPQTITLPSEQGKPYVLHPIHLTEDAADKRPAALARYERASGEFLIPARTALVYVVMGERKSSDVR